MPSTKRVAVRDLALDLHNYRTLPQRTERAAIHALTAIDTDYFWGLMESLLDSGYLPTENVIVLKDGEKLIVREGNRRVAALKIALGLVKKLDLSPPPDLAERIDGLSKEWKAENDEVPCTIYGVTEAETVDRIVALTHGKGERAGRVVWKAVARARHNRKPLASGGTNEPGLDLLELYLQHGKNLTDDQRERWAGDYALTVLDEAMKRLARIFGLSAGREILNLYPKDGKRRAGLESLMHGIGMKEVKFESVRKSDFGLEYGFAPAAPKDGAGDPATARPGARGGNAGGDGGAAEDAAKGQAERKTRGVNKATSSTDPRSVVRTLKAFHPRGRNREKIVDLVEEARQLSLANTPLAFCFVLRSMFELSAKAYCADHAAAGLTMVRPDGTERKLVDVLREISKFISNREPDKGAQKAMEKVLHGAMAELGNPHSILSVTSMNQLVHNPKFIVDERQVCVSFSNVFPLLEQMNS